MEILTSVKRLYISFKSLVNDFVYSFGRAALLLLVEVQNHTVPVRERGRIRVDWDAGWAPEPVWTVLRSEKFLTLPRNRTLICPSRSLVCVFHNRYLELVHFRMGVLRTGY